MDRDELIELAVKSGILPWTKKEWSRRAQQYISTDEGLDGDLGNLHQFAQLVAMREREACAKLLEDLAGREGWEVVDCPDAIRNRELA